MVPPPQYGQPPVNPYGGIAPDPYGAPNPYGGAQYAQGMPPQAGPY